MGTTDWLSKINPKSIGYGKGGTNPLHKGYKYDNTRGIAGAVRNLTNPAHRTLDTANLSKEDVAVIMDILDDIIGRKSNKYIPLDRYDEMEFRHKLEEAFRHGKLSRLDIDDAWKIWKNFKK